jgi:hypothetical protein
MSSISKIVNILSAKYGFDTKEATEHVKAEIQAYKNMTKEEKDAIKEAEKQAKADAKAVAKQAKDEAKALAKQEREAKKAEKASKPKKERTPAQEAAFQKMIAANKAKRDAKFLLAVQELSENVVVSAEPPVNTDEAYQAEMNAKLEQHEAAEKKVKKEKKTKKTAETVEVSTLLPPLIQEEAPLEKKVKKEKKSKKPVEDSSDDKMLAVFDNL